VEHSFSSTDPISGASSVESLASNASLPSCISGSSRGNFEYGTHRASLRAVNPNQIEDLAAGRISHWAVSFDRLLDDPLGVRYFKVGGASLSLSRCTPLFNRLLLLANDVSLPQSTDIVRTETWSIGQENDLAEVSLLV